jgi:hypothetical protein
MTTMTDDELLTALFDGETQETINSYTLPEQELAPEQEILYHNTGFGFIEIIDLQKQPDPRTLFVEEETEEGL